LFGLLPRFVVWVAGLCPVPGVPALPPPTPYPSCLPTPHRFGWSAARSVGLGLPTPHCPIGRVHPTKTGPWSSNAPTGQPGGTSLRRDPLGYFSPFLTPPSPHAISRRAPPKPSEPLCLGRPTDWVGRVEEGREDPGEGL